MDGCCFVSQRYCQRQYTIHPIRSTGFAKAHWNFTIDPGKSANRERWQES
jgi:hypothetical protein